MKFRLVSLAGLAALVLAGCQDSQTHAAPSLPWQPAKASPTLARAIARAVDLGPADASTTVSLSLGLSGDANPTAVAHAVAAIDADGLSARWQAPSSLIAADGPAPAAASMLRVAIENFRLPDGTTFYAARGEPQLAGALAPVVVGVSGLDNYRRARGYAVRSGGLTPADLVSFYNIKALHDAGLDGSGQTIMLPEIDDLPNLNDLDKYASTFGLPPFDPILTVKRDPNWGNPQKAEGETVLDLEIAHAVAPAAKLVVYLSAPDFGHGDRAFDQMVTDHLGSIISESLGSCEADTPAGARNTYASIQDRATALGISHFAASGDNGAYTCGLDQDPSGSFPSTLPTITAVGGTTVFESEQGVYFKEYAWSSPIDQSGGGGGASQFYTVPTWQQNEAKAAGHGRRQVPDVAADGDPSTGFHIIFGGHNAQAGGTSAATPLWAATVALINQDLKQKKMRQVGFANPAIYWMGENSSKFPARPFHDVTAGNNLGFDASVGWDFATGWGSMDAAALDAAWIRYIKSGGG